jgi:hypothetical protein
MDKAELEFYISYLLSQFAVVNGVEVKDIKVKSERTDGVFNSGWPSYMVEVTYK